VRPNSRGSCHTVSFLTIPGRVPRSVWPAARIDLNQSCGARMLLPDDEGDT